MFAILNTEEKYLKDLRLKIRRPREEKSLDQKSFAFYSEIGRTQLYKIGKQTQES